ncbi:MAG: hypothetical protein DHS20C21_15440 [Gemmatimonadota bacterium]|nr:MAG: hypothetical protein DHS20C21_15440 [Gemmatimonadota bacterium]
MNRKPKWARSLTLVLAGAAFAGSPAAAEPETWTVVAVVDLVAEGYGGREALNDFPGFHARGSVLSLADGLSGRLLLDVSLEGDMRSEVSYPRRKEVRILAGPMAWNGGHHGQRPSTPDMAASMRLQYHRLAAPFELVSADPAELAFEGLAENGRLLIVRQWNEQARTTYEIDVESGLILNVRGEIGEEDDGLLFETEAHDFRPVDGVLFPFRMTTIVGGSAAAETILDRLTREDDFEPTRFLPAGSAGDM